MPATDATRPTVVIVGAGVAGLSAARSIGEWIDAKVILVDKGRSVGGRLATRRIGEATLDHGAQFLTTHTADFADAVATWESDGLVRSWFRGRLGADGVEERDGHPRFAPTVSMTALAKHLAVGLDVRCGVQVESLTRSDRGWRLRVHHGPSLDIDADAVVLTAPVPQTLEMLDLGGVVLAESQRAALDMIGYDPCLAALVPLRAASTWTDPGAYSPGDGIIDTMVDNAVKGISTRPAVTIHATAAYSRDVWDHDESDVLDELIGAAGLGGLADRTAAQVKRWRYARPVTTLPEPCLVLDHDVPLVCAGDAFGGPNVEGAFLSAVAAGRAVVTALRSDPTSRHAVGSSPRR